jgi:Lrp/AsnC family transcriptional regulator
LNADMAKLDETDLKILRAVQADATLSSAQVARRVGMSQSPAWRRVINLEKRGAIKKRVALIDRHVVGLRSMVYVLIRLKDQTQRTVDDFQARVRLIPEIVQCYMLMGDIDFLLLAITEDLEAYHKLLRDEISRIPGVSGIDSRVVVEETKSTTELPLNGLIRKAKSDAR